MNEDKLLGLWINRILLEHFRNQKKEHADKLFVKISGLTEANVYSLLNELRVGLNT